MESIEDDPKISNEMSTSSNILNVKDEDINNGIISTSINIINEKDVEIHNEKEKDDKITLEDLNDIINEPDEQEKENEEKKEDAIDKKDGSHSSQDELIENELALIKKQNLSKYLMANNEFISSNTESEEEQNHNNEIVKPTKCKLYKFVGRTLFLFLDKNENPLLIIGPHWPMYICFCGIISLIMLVIYLTLWSNFGIVMKIMGNICYWTYFLSYTHCSLYNPGYPKNDIGRKSGYPRKEYYFCGLCRFYVRNSRFVHHCTECDICIENQDHHCPWTGHCIGRNNYYSFFVFIGSSFCIIVYIALAVCVGASKYN